MYSNINKVYYNPTIPSNIAIYPNPASNYIKIAGPNISAITISNTLGQIVFSKNYNNPNSFKTINIQPFARGVYYVQFYNNATLIQTQKIVIQ
jgi:hypothetical protein